MSGEEAREEGSVEIGARAATAVGTAERRGAKPDRPAWQMGQAAVVLGFVAGRSSPGEAVGETATDALPNSCPARLCRGRGAP
jgi:hypothetical protein